MEQDGSSESEDSSQREVSSYKTVRALISLVSSNSSIISDPRKCEGFLRDACFNSREVFILVTAVKAGAVQRISEIEKTAIPTMSLDLEIRMLHENYGIDQQAARWAIESWAIALGKLEADRNKSPVTKPEDITNECNRLLLKGAYLEANKCYDKIINSDATLINVWHNKGLALINLTLYDEAIKCFEKAAVRKDNNTLSSYYRRALLSYSMGKFKDAVKNIEKAIKLGSNESEAWKFKAHILRNKLLKYSEAKKCYDQSITMNPNQPDVWYNKARTLTTLGDYVGAIQCYNNATDLNPNYAEAWNNKGNVFHTLKQYVEAINSFDRALAINRNDARIWYNKGNVFLNLENPEILYSSKTNLYETAIQCYNNATDLNPNYAEAWNNKGLALEKVGRKQEAKVSLGKAKSLQRIQ